MILLTAVALSIFGYVVAQDSVCDLRQDVGANQWFYINNPEYPNYYNPGRSCRYVAVCPNGYNCRADCRIELPSSTNCAGDRILVSVSGDPTLAGAVRYCGTQTFTALSSGTTLALGLVTTTAPSSRGRYLCNVTAQIAAPTPPPGCTCGQSRTTRIVGGNKTRPYEFPMMVGIVETATDAIYCGGVIISDRYVMTAAHCVYNFRPAELIIIAGTYYIDDGRTGTKYAVLQFIIHEQFNINTYDYDIALILTKLRIVFNNNVQPVCLPFKYSSNPNLTGNNVTLLGWGTTFFGGPTSNALRKVIVSIISQSVCRSTESNVTDRKFCTLTPGKDACQLDSGGPVLLVDPSTGLLMSVGIISSGDGCGTRRPGLQTNVVVLLNWVVNRANTSFCNIR